MRSKAGFTVSYGWLLAANPRCFSASAYTHRDVSTR
jgi:hypothetical protein